IGNSILVHHKVNQNIFEYIFIGQDVRSFNTKQPILQYKSPVGNSAVPYPFAVGPTYTYCMIESKVIPNSSYCMDPYVEGIYVNNPSVASFSMKLIVPRSI